MNIWINRHTGIQTDRQTGFTYIMEYTIVHGHTENMGSVFSHNEVQPLPQSVAQLVSLKLITARK